MGAKGKKHHFSLSRARCSSFVALFFPFSKASGENDLLMYRTTKISTYEKRSRSEKPSGKTNDKKNCQTEKKKLTAVRRPPPREPPEPLRQAPVPRLRADRVSPASDRGRLARGRVAAEEQARARAGGGRAPEQARLLRRRRWRCWHHRSFFFLSLFLSLSTRKNVSCRKKKASREGGKETSRSLAFCLLGPVERQRAETVACLSFARSLSGPQVKSSRRIKERD